MNNKGFTLIELMASIILLAIIMSVTAISVISLIDYSKEKSYKLLINNIKIGAQEYFDECDNVGIVNSTLPSSSCSNMISSPCVNGVSSVSGVSCENNKISQATMSLSTMIDYGFLQTNATDRTQNKIVENPKNNENISSCRIKIIKYVNKTDFSANYIIERVDEYITIDGKTVNCPTNEDYTS